MKTEVFVTVIATILEVDGGQATVDKGLLDGLLPGDRGEAYYVLLVGNEDKTIRSGAAEIKWVDQHDAGLQADPGTDLKPGTKIEFQLSPSRLSTASILRHARSHWSEAKTRELAGRLLEELIELDPKIAEELRDIVGIEPGGGVEMREVPAGEYWIGSDSSRYFNQRPRFPARLEAFVIDREPVSDDSGAWLHSLSYQEAEDHCRSLGKGLPSEIQWEAAITQLDLAETVRAFEWTSSWYRPYPGNERREKEYGQVYRVVRGRSEGEAFDPRNRFFLPPERRSTKVGFRCVGEAGH